MIKKYIEYLKDNPERYWFKRKLYGWGWTPATKEGWLVIIAYLTIVFLYVFNLDARSFEVDWVIELALPILLLVSSLIFICYKTGEPPKWTWGLPKDDADKKADELKSEIKLPTDDK